MPHRKLVKIGATPKLPTIRKFFQEMADRQGEEIRKLKESLGVEADCSKLPAHRLVPDPWQLHPIKKSKKAK